MSVYTVFIDALKPSSLRHMDFLKTLSSCSIEPDLINFSNTCQASIYTGVYPNKHNHQFIWTLDPQNSPFELLDNRVADFSIRDKYTKFLVYNLLALKNLKTVPYGFLYFADKKPSYWANFSFEEVSHSGRPDHCLGGYPTVFELIHSAEMEYSVDWHVSDDLSDIEIQDTEEDFNYFYFGHVDPASHKHGQESDEAIEVMKQIDLILEQIYEQTSENDTFIVLSDHGHVHIENFINLADEFERNGENLNDYMHFVDSCYARFWPKSDVEKQRVTQVLESMEKGEIITTDLLRQFNSELNCDQDVILYYLSPPNVFDVVNPKTESMHGFDCRLPDSKGVFVTDDESLDAEEIQLQDFLPTVLNQMNISIPPHVDGENIL
ncbi:alkaline phosphatase family protein [Haloferax sp. YSMS24]|uniref:alkaline phosphatase family protein n=1 Tax=Haloferax sp. YSMS24 TaxID=3388425 RepID=UPI00398D4A08